MNGRFFIDHFVLIRKSTPDKVCNWNVIYLLFERKTREEESESERSGDDLTIYVTLFIVAILFSAPIIVPAFFPIILSTNDAHSDNVKSVWYT